MKQVLDHGYVNRGPGSCLSKRKSMTEERVNHPAHYGGADNPYEAIKVIEAWALGFCLGNTVKYISRAGRKSDSTTIEDLRKARWYLERKIASLEAAQDP